MAKVICNMTKCKHRSKRPMRSYIKKSGEKCYGCKLDVINIVRVKLEEFYKEKENAGWIPVEERLPENAKHKGTFCPKYQVDTKYGVTEGWYNPDVKSWYCLFWFMTKRYLQHEIDFKKGDAPEVVRVPVESDIVIAWRPLPEAYRPKVTKP